DDSTFATISDRLQRLGKRDLYDFLGLRRNASLVALAERGRREGAEARKFNTKTVEGTARQERAGFCLRFFQAADERQKYDNTPDGQGLAGLDPLIGSAGSRGEIRAEAMDQLLRKARERGLPLDEAREYIRAVAAKRGWPVEVPKAPRAAELHRCACGVL